MEGIDILLRHLCNYDWSIGVTQCLACSLDHSCRGEGEVLSITYPVIYQVTSGVFGEYTLFQVTSKTSAIFCTQIIHVGNYLAL